MTEGYFHDILILLIIAVAVLALFLRLRLPPILGYLTVGTLVGPYGLGWIDSSEHTHELAEFGVVFLLFTIGLEFSLSLLMRMKKAVLGLGGFQVLVTAAITTTVAMYMGLQPGVAVVLGGVIAMSSTALVIRQLTEQAELHTRHGRNAVGILLFQDVIVIPFLILVTTLTGETADTPGFALLLAGEKGLFALVIILAAGRWVVRPLFRLIASYSSTELFTLTVLFVALGAAWITHQLGLSLALGAFLAGMMLGETEFRHQIDAEIKPFRDVLLGLFFITVGMLLNIGLLTEIWPWVLLLLVILVVVKLLIIAGFCRLFGWDSAVSLRTGLILAHGGEFGFAILTLALNTRLVPEDIGQIVLAALLISMATAPLAIRYSGRIVKKILPAAMKMTREVQEEEIRSTSQELHDHVILCGYGRVGQNIARILADAGIPYTALDLDPVRVQYAVAAKEPVHYGDAANMHLLEAAGLSRAAVLVISVAEHPTTMKILHRLRAVNRDIPVLVRTTDDSHLEELQAAGATEIIPEATESSLLLATQLLLMLKVPAATVDMKIRQIRHNRYRLLHQLFPGEETEPVGGTMQEQLSPLELTGKSWATGRRLDELELDKLEVTVTAIQQQDQRLINPLPDTRLSAGDTLVLFGTPQALEEAAAILLRE